ncbi:fibronectin type III domain-containing protein [Haloarcula sp. JP-L23]|uniref:fibronectin type III domain-containing protein n=1 Tax=Haloarcula sp. JP-L23 TaxID=2716717 RepID=UPI00140F20B6|nr:fibronectin type III domain-containing protein [Haloarcula sp. JP-L23]
MYRQTSLRIRPVTVALLLSVGLVAAGTGAMVATAATSTDDLAVQTAWADPLSETSMVTGANVTRLPDDETATVSVYYRPNGTSDWQRERVTNVTTTGLQYVELTGLQPETEYEYYAEATANGSVATGDVKSFVTLRDRPDVVATGASDVTESAATLRANVTDLGGATGAIVTFEYRPQSADSWTVTAEQQIGSTGPVAEQVAGLAASTDYEYRVTVRDADGDEALSARSTFRTDDPVRVVTGTATDVTQHSATLTGEITDFGGASPEVVAFEYRRVGADNWERADATLASDGTFSATVGSLSPGTSYEYRALASTTDGDGDRGTVQSVTTVADPAVRTGSASTVGETTATVAGNLTTLGGADEATVAVQYRQAGTDVWTTAATETRSTVGPFAVSLSDLSSGTDYEYRAVVTTADGARDTGAVRTFSTDRAASPPTLDSLSARDTSPPNPHVELDVDWRVSDVDGDLDSVTVTVRDGDGLGVRPDDPTVAGGTASGSLFASVKKGAGETYTVTLTVQDVAGETTTGAVRVSTGR